MSSEKKKIVTIVGARPQFVKAAVLSRIIEEDNTLQEVIVHTGQHFDANMSAIFFEEMSIKKPDYHFEIHSLPRQQMIDKMFDAINSVIEKELPDAIVVYGDTNSTLAGALSAEHNNIKLVHIEAGLRSFNLEMPEEHNRILTDQLSDLLLCPSQTAIDNLAYDKTKKDAVIVNCGDIMKDAVEFYSVVSEEKSTIVNDLNLEVNNFVLATIHRQENTDKLENLKGVFDALQNIHKETTVVLPLHPRTKKALEKHNLNYDIKFIDPIGYFDMLALLKHCKLVVTDSGGLQKEAFFNKKYCIIAREQTEWIELVQQGFASIVGSDTKEILEAYSEYKNEQLDFSVNLYGNKVGSKILNEIKDLLGK